MNILKDGSIEGKSFSGDLYKGEYPRPKSGERFADYNARVRLCEKQGFNLGDLSWSDYSTYCMGSGYYEGVDSSDRIQ